MFAAPSEFRALLLYCYHMHAQEYSMLETRTKMNFSTSNCKLLLSCFLRDASYRAGVGIHVPHAAGASAGLPIPQPVQQHQRTRRLPVHQQLRELHGWFQLRCAVFGRCSEWQRVRLRSTRWWPLIIINLNNEIIDLGLQILHASRQMHQDHATTG